MPKRIVDGEGIWQSGKIAQITPPKYRAEYANLLPLALANGTFEADDQRIWAQVYAFNRPEISLKELKKILAELERVKLLFRWTHSDGKIWGFWVGIDKIGRLPSASRLDKGHDRVGPNVPFEQLNEFLGQPKANQRPDVGRHGTGLGFGTGTGLGIGNGTGKGNGTVGPSASAAAPHTGADSVTERNRSVAGSSLNNSDDPNPPKLNSRSIQALETLSYTSGAPNLSPEQYAGAETVLRLNQDAALPRFIKIVEILRWAQIKSNFWPTKVIDPSNLAKVEEQYDKFYAKVASGKKPHEVALALQVDDESEEGLFVVDDLEDQDGLE